MIKNNKTKNIKKLRREAAILKNLVIILHKIISKKDIFFDITFNKVNITADGSFILVFIHSPTGKEIGQKAIDIFNSYNKQIYHELCQSLQYRHVPHLKFIYDEQYDKVIKINSLLDKISSEE